MSAILAIFQLFEGVAFRLGHRALMIVESAVVPPFRLSFENKVALITGAGSGLGLATAKAFAESGASVALADVNENAVRSAGEELNAGGHKALAIRCDVADDAQVEAMVQQTVTTFGRIDAAYNNAGVQNALAETADSPGTITTG